MWCTCLFCIVALNVYLYFYISDYRNKNIDTKTSMVLCIYSFWLLQEKFSNIEVSNLQCIQAITYNPQCEFNLWHPKICSYSTTAVLWWIVVSEMRSLQQLRQCHTAAVWCNTLHWDAVENDVLGTQLHCSGVGTKILRLVTIYSIDKQYCVCITHTSVNWPDFYPLPYSHKNKCKKIDNFTICKSTVKYDKQI